MGTVNAQAGILAQFATNKSLTQLPDMHSVVCDVDIVPSISFQEVHYSRVSTESLSDLEFQDPQFESQYLLFSGVEFFIAGTGKQYIPYMGDQGIPFQLSSILTDWALAVGAVTSGNLSLKICTKTVRGRRCAQGQ